MALLVARDAPTLFIRREAYERTGLTRRAIDERLGLTSDEFRVEADLVAIGPILGEDGEAIGELVAEAMEKVLQVLYQVDLAQTRPVLGLNKGSLAQRQKRVRQ
jgi:hypothetical protein